MFKICCAIKITQKSNAIQQAKPAEIVPDKIMAHNSNASLKAFPTCHNITGVIIDKIE